jgi:Carboxypeptidase regulatory-like domain
VLLASIYILACLLLPACPVSAQTPPAQIPSGSLHGLVVDPTGALIPNAAVTLDSLRTSTDPTGVFRFDAIPPGDHDLTVEAHGFRLYQQSHLQIRSGETLRIRIELKIEVQHQQISVAGETFDSSPAHSLGAIVLKPHDLDALPTNPQDLQQQLQAMAGSDPNSPTHFYVDGFTATRLPPKSSIREIRINNNPYSTQYDDPGFSRIEVFTKPGSDTLHGDLDLLGDDSAFNSRNPFVDGQPSYSSFYAQGDLNGPLTKNSSYFFAAARQDIGAQSFIHAITSSTGPAFTDTVNSPQTSVDINPRVDIQLGKIHTLSLRYEFSHQTQDNLLQSQLSLPSEAVNTRHTDQTLQLSDTQTWSPHIVNETRFQFMRSNDSTVSINGAASLYVEGAFNGGGNINGQIHDGQNHYELQDYLSILLGNHLLRIGGRFRNNIDSNTSTTGYNGLFTFPSIQAYEITQQGLAQGLTPAQIRAAGGGASQFALNAGSPKITIGVADFGAYLEDEWKMRPNMTLNYGMRFETQTHIHDHADFAPRLSYAWSIGAKDGQQPKAVLRAGIGIFYQRFLVDQVLNATRQNGIQQQIYVVHNPDFYPLIPNPSDLGPTTLPTVFRINPLLHAPYTVQQGVSLEKQFFQKLSASLDYTYTRGADLLLTRNINAPLPGAYNVNDPTSGVRPSGTLQNIYDYESEGASKRNRLLLHLVYRTQPITLYGYYILGYDKANTSGANSFPSNQYNLHADYGRASDDIHHRAYFGGLLNLPWQFVLNPFLVLQSSAPFNITVGEDLNGDSQFNDRPAFATDLSRPSVYRTRWGNFDANPTPGQTIIPINRGTGPSLAMLNLSFGRNFAFGPKVVDPSAPAPPAPKPGQKPKKIEVQRKFQLNLGMEGQNIFNTVNGGTPIGVLGSPIFGQSTSLSTTQFSASQANRILYLHLALSF